MLYCSPVIVHVFIPLFPVLVLFPMSGLVSIVHSNVSSSGSSILIDNEERVIGMSVESSDGFGVLINGAKSVSYTHLTLPTN